MKTKYNYPNYFTIYNNLDNIIRIDKLSSSNKEKSSEMTNWTPIAAIVVVVLFLPIKCTMLKITEVNQPKNIEKAMEAYNDGDYETSLKYWNKTDLKKDKPKDLSFFRDETDRVGKIRKSSVWWVRKANTYEKLGQKEKAEYLFNKIYSNFVWTENNYPGHIKSNYPDVYQGIINSDTYKQKHEEAVKAHKEFLDELSKCQTVTSRWLEYNGELGTIYRILAIPYWSDDYTFWIDDGKSDKLAGGIFLYTDINKDYLKKEFKDLAYYAAPTYFYIKYYNRKSELVYIED